MAKNAAELIRGQIKAKRVMIVRLNEEIAALESLVPPDTRQVEMPVVNHGKVK